MGKNEGEIGAEGDRRPGWHHPEAYRRKNVRTGGQRELFTGARQVTGIDAGHGNVQPVHLVELEQVVYEDEPFARREQSVAIFGEGVVDTLNKLDATKVERS